MKKLTYVFIILSLCLCAFMLTSCEKTYDITYELNGGENSPDNPMEYKKGETVSLGFPEREDYMFAGWYTEPTFENRIMKITEADSDITLYAKWIELGKVLSFKLDKDFYIVNGCRNNVEFIAIPSTYKSLPVTIIGVEAFKDCQNVKYVYMPDSIITVGAGSFWNCTSLEEIRLSENLINIYTLAFAGCESLKNIDIPNSVTTLSSAAFSRTGITSITIPEGITTLDYQMFSDCKYLSEVNLPKNLTTIKFNAFWDCDSLETIVIPKSVSTIGEELFIYCDSIKNVEVEEGNEFFKSIDGVLYSKDGKKLIYYPAGKTDTSYTVSDGAEIIDFGAFRESGHLVSVSIPNTLKEIRSNAFADSVIESVILPDSVTEIGFCAFRNCTSLKELKLSSNLKSIDNLAFENCTSLESIIIPGSLEYMGLEAFSTCTSLKSVEIQNGVQSIGRLSFLFCESLESIILPDSITVIELQAFGECSSLKSIKLSKNLQSIENGAFRRCTSFESIVIPSSVTSLEGGTFMFCDNLVVYCEAENQPDGWANGWDKYVKEVVWGYKGN